MRTDAAREVKVRLQESTGAMNYQTRRDLLFNTTSRFNKEWVTSGLLLAIVATRFQQTRSCTHTKRNAASAVFTRAFYRLKFCCQDALKYKWLDDYVEKPPFIPGTWHALRLSRTSSAETPGWLDLRPQDALHSPEGGDRGR